jgi:homoserine kinase
MTIKTISRKTLKTRTGDLDVVILSNGNVQLCLYGNGVTVTHFLTREEAMQLGKNIEDVVEKYDAWHVETGGRA